MAVSSPTFAAPEAVRTAVPATARSRPVVSSGGASSALAPSVTLPLRFVITGVLALLAGLVLLAARPDILAAYHYNQYVVAATHLFVLGFVCTIVMGAMYQLVPVALETRLHSERTAKWQFAFHVIGVAGMVWMFWRWDLKQVGHFGSVVAMGVGLFAYNIGRTLWCVPRWNVVATGIASALFWLVCAVTAGLVVTAAKCTYDSVATLSPVNPLWAALKALQGTANFVNRFDALGVMHAHAHLGVVGFFVMMIVSVSYKLVPMFLLSDLQNERRARLGLWLLNAAVLGLFFTIALRSAWKLAFALLGAAAVTLYLVEMRAILRARRRRLIDWGLRHFVMALWLLGGATVLGVVLATSWLPVTERTVQLETVYAWLGIVGVVTFTILGFLYKIVPFIVWHHNYSHHVGRHKVPSLADLYSEPLQIAGFWLFLGGFALAAAGAGLMKEGWARAGVLVLLASLAVFGINLAGMLRHFFRPRLAPLVPAAKPVLSKP
ncbi:MAG: cbb3-type cytochrome c oxidase subunit I [Verrucomicrobia bacterium]|nr:cbb3-type cytochrome c oxidase subunit I [Verrucomicrobiota bacterium]